MKTTDDKCVEYLEMFRDRNYILLSEELKKENVEVAMSFCYYVSKYEGVGHLDFLRKLIQ